MDLVTMLKKNPEQLPHWLRQPSSGFDRESFFDGRTVYYPGFGNDGCPVSICSRAHAAHAFVYVDYGYTREAFMSALNNQGFLGYDLLAIRSVTEQELAPHGWHPDPPTPDDGDPSHYRDWIKEPFCDWCVFQRQ